MMDELYKQYEGHDGQLRGDDSGGQHVQAPKVHQYGGDGQASLTH